MSLDDQFVHRLHRSADRLFGFIDRFAEATVLVVGDLTLDEFLTGYVERVSREAPVMILRHEETRQIPGGGANGVYNFACLGAKVKAVGLLGSDLQGQALAQLFQAVGIETEGVLCDPDRPTVTKTRISGHARQSVIQQVVRIDRKSEQLPSVELQARLAEYILEQVHEVDAIVCSDYGDGTLTQPVINAALKHWTVIVDSQKQIPLYHGGFLFTPNLPEAELAVGYSIHDAYTLSQAGKDLLRMTQAENILITRGEQGMTWFDREGNQEHIPAFNRAKVFDVTGAGDTVVAASTLGLIAGASVWEAIVLGNLAASIVVRKLGTATTSRAEMKLALEALLKEEF